MTDERRRIDVLLDQVADQALRDRIAAEITQITGKKKWGLNFEEHLPEGIRIPKARVRRGVRAQLRDGSDPRYWEVKRVVGGVAQLHHDGETREVPTGDLVVARVFDEPVYPGFTPLGSIERGGDKPHHLVIEGENFHALETLRYTHEGKVDLIYIDPPYNTGAGDWIYNDRYVGDADAYRHSKWLSFMQKRLELARHLLAPTGVIIVAIDDNEHHRLRVLLDEVFGEQNFLGNVVWQGGRKNNVKFIADTHDYMLFFAKDKALLSTGDAWKESRPGYDELLQAGLDAWEESGHDAAAATALLRNWRRALPADHPARAERGLNMYDQVDGHPKHAGKVYSTGDLRNPFPRPNLQYDIPHPVDGKPVKMHPNGWIWSRERMMQAIEDGIVVFAPDSTGSARQKRFLEAGSQQSVAPVFTQDRSKATRSLAAILGTNDFPFPKDVDVIARWVNIATGGQPSAVVLDFFAGTGTTAHAVLQLNATDGGHRQSIVVTNNEVGQKAATALTKAGHAAGDPEWEAEGVFEKVTLPRIQTVVTGTRRDGSKLTDPVMDADGKKIASGIPGAIGYDENVTFLKLDYLDRDDIAADDAFRQIATLLWVKAGGRGPVIAEHAEAFAAPEGANYAVLFSVAEWAPFVELVNSRPELETVYVVSDSETTYGPIVRAMRPEVSSFRLYENYLSNFEINVGGR